MLLQVAVLIITLIATKKVSDKSDLHCSRRKYPVVPVYYLIRLLSIISTYGYVSRRYLLDTHYNTGFNANFSDLVISEHVGLTWILAIDILKHGLCWQKNIATWLAVLSAYVNLAVGDHYSSDVILGAIISTLLQYSTLF